MAANLDPNGIYPQGQIIAFGFYSAIGQNDYDPSMSNIERLADEGFTLAGPYYNSVVTDYIQEASDAGLRFTHQVRQHPALEGVAVDDRPAVISALTDQQIIDWTRSQIQLILDNATYDTAVARWSLQPEELRYWKSEEMRYLEVVSNAIKQVEAEYGVAHRPFWMYEPNHRTAQDMINTGVHQDIVSRGVYMTTRFPRGDQRSGYALAGVDAITSAATTLGNTPQAVFQLSEDFTDPLTGTNPDEIRKVLRHDVYLGLVHGIKSLNVWSMWETRPGLTTHNEQFEAYGSVANELTGELNLQRIFLFGEERNDLTIVQTQGQTTITYDDGDQVKTYDAISSLNVAYEDDRYLFLVNSTETDAAVTVAGLPGADGYLIHDLFQGTVIYSSDNAITVSLENLGVRAIRFTTALAGDLNQDGFVGLADLDIVLNHWNQSVVLGNWAQGDIAGVGDGYVGLSDLDVLLSNWNSGIAPSAMDTLQVIPEPATVLILFVNALMALRR